MTDAATVRQERRSHSHTHGRRRKRRRGPHKPRKPEFRLTPKVVVRIYSPNIYPGLNSQRIIVLHSTEGRNIPGNGDLKTIAQFFGSSSSKVSAQVTVDDDGHSARHVRDSDAAWACAADNDRSLNIEECGFARQLRWSMKERNEAARWIAQWSHDYGIPIRRSTSHGVCTHKDLGQAGGGHEDPGSGYPVKAVLARALVIRYLRYGPKRSWKRR